MKKFLSIILTIIMSAAMTLVGCQQKSDSSVKKIGFIVSTLNNPFFVDLKSGIEERAKERGYEVVVLDSQNEPAKEVSNMEDLTVKDVDIVLLNPVDSDSAVASVMIANNYELPVVTVDRAANGGDVVTHIASDNAVGGSMAAQYLIDQLDGKGNIVELEGTAGSSAARDRGQGFDDKIAESDMNIIAKQIADFDRTHGKGNIVELEGTAGSSAARDRGQGFDDKIAESDMNIIAKQIADFDRTQGLTVMENILQSKSDIDAVFAQNDEMALGAQKALEDMGMKDVLIVGFDATDDAVEAVKNGTNIDAVFAQNDEMALGAQKALEDMGMKDVLIVGFDATDDAVEAVKNGTMAATVAQQPLLIGEAAVNAIDKILKGEKVDNFIPVELKLITRN